MYGKTMKKMNDGPMIVGKKSHDEHARTVHKRVDTPIKHPANGHAMRHSATMAHGSGNQAHSSKKGLPNSAKMPNPKMGRPGVGGY